MIKEAKNYTLVIIDYKLVLFKNGKLAEKIKEFDDMDEVKKFFDKKRSSLGKERE